MPSHDAAFDDFLKRIATPELPSLGPQGRRGTRNAEELQQTLTTFFDTHRTPAARRDLLRSAALLWHDHLDASHSISQGIETRDGSWLHGIMHRREPDYGNAKYWFRRVGQHPAFADLAERVAEALRPTAGELAARLIEHGEWQPFAFVDECERAAAGSDETLRQQLQTVQALEWEALVKHICRH